MPNLEVLLPPSAVLHDVSVANKPDLLALLARHGAALTSVDATVIAAALAAREAVGATGFGGGTAIPHARLEGLGAVHAVMARLHAPIDYAAIDGQPVDLVVMLLAPATADAVHRADHLKALARFSRMLRDVALVERLRNAASAEALYALMRAHDFSALHSRAA